MWMYLEMAAAALIFGTATSAGTFALLVTLGIIPRMAGRTRTGKWIPRYEDMICLGGTVGCVISLLPWVRPSYAAWTPAVFGLCAGIFVGCQAVALAEILNVFPIMFRRIKLKTGLSYIMIAMALGKMAGALFYFYYGYQPQ